MLSFDILANTWQIAAYSLVLSVFGLLVGGFIFNPYDAPRRSRMPVITELPQSFLLIILTAIIWQQAARGTDLQALGMLFTLGIAFGFLGDLFMADVFDQENNVLFGMASFALGHVFYMLGFRQIVMAFGLTSALPYLFGMIVMWAAAVVIWLLLVRSPDGDQTMQRAALGYALFLATMAGYALGIALQAGAFWSMIAGAALFLFSDALIAADIFGERRFPHMGDVIWGTYILAQFLIVTALPVAVGLL